ncbi:constitutive coactivator of peroxisome proliferator-activated receptor gamma isoform X1 [Lemur catta]|uniref:constitutive coactivator of peroxisome proliferator-activated receptor gamma isoform X1 n=1 Tax=Lemur catta TaxID=9447 RepID=UPI001E269CE7|nr:constitutive coactivator of peroxisome proliferator-activated receptor gamma isoform X1 [Lemur catta]XP_045400710.1 constitutive coactivator of peroxisome proliferator-activated receptor gamma isoform X1 [Lemur catta]
MGVRGLQGFVASTCPHVCTVVNLKDLAAQHRSRHPGCAPTVVVDAMCCLRYWYTPESWVCGGQWREYFSALRDFVKSFTAAGIRLVFFFDGMVEQGKRGEWVRRRLKNSKEISRIFHHLRSHRQQPGRNMFFIPSGLALFTRFALKALGQETFCSLREADYEVASYGLQHNCLGILGEDTDYLIYDTCPYFSISELCLESLDTVLLCRERLCESLGLHLADLPLLACLLGNDTVPEGTFESFRYKCLSSYTSVKENFDKKGNVILAVSDYIAKVLHLHQGEKKLEDILPLGPNKALFYKGVASYLLPGQKSPWFFQKPKGIITLNKQVITVSSDPEPKQDVPMCTDPESQQNVSVCTDPESRQEVPMCTDPESGQEVPMCTDPESGQEVPVCTDPEWKQEVPVCTNPESKQEVPLYADPESKQEVSVCTHPEIQEKLPVAIDAEFKLEASVCTHPEIEQEDAMSMGPEIKQQVTMVSDTEILEVARTRHVQAESYLVHSIMSSGEIECSNTLEDELDQALPSQAFIYRPVRQRVYSLLLGSCKDGVSTCPAVKEWFVYPGNPLKHPDLVRPLPMTVPGGMPSLKMLWLNQEPEVQVRRLDTLLACFNLSSSREELQALESPLAALCCLLIYLFVQVDTLCLEDLHAFIAQALCLQGKSTAQLVNLQPDYVNSRAVQLGSLLVRGLTTLVLVNCACGCPWRTSEFMPWHVFDGKLFHQKYLQAEKGYSVEALLEQNGGGEDRAPAPTGRTLGTAALAKDSRGGTRDQETDSMSMTSGEDTSHPPARTAGQRDGPRPVRNRAGSRAISTTESGVQFKTQIVYFWHFPVNIFGPRLAG